MTTCLVVGAGPGLGAAFARIFSREGMRVALAAREVGKLEAVCRETGARAFACDATREADVARLFETVTDELDSPRLVIYNASWRTRGPIAELDAADVERALAVSAFGGFLVGREAARRMLADGSGAIFFTGASASVKGYAQSAPFAMGKFALRGLAQSMARELAPKGIHVAHFVIDGAIRNPARVEPLDEPESMLDPMAIAETY
ncbi:MAG TPA: SDR family NAD(P)-dependent oxidoreductase, partial [Usitatibacter sp.]|nr:SDR family NAD(P)-dependent oxidoreductase [Usitatibacter sp.]